MSCGLLVMSIKAYVTSCLCRMELGSGRQARALPARYPDAGKQSLSNMGIASPDCIGIRNDG